jgi:hypothetical protein
VNLIIQKQKIDLMKKSFSCVLLIILFFVQPSRAQSYQTQSRQIFATNILVNGFIGGVGGMINRRNDENLLKVFGKNFLKGSLGGAIIYTAKYETYQLTNPDKYWVAPLDRAFYYIGYSFVRNASLNQSLLNSYHCQFYLFNFDIQLKNKFKILPRISILSTYSLAYFCTLNDHFNLKNTLKYGVFFFDENSKYFQKRGGEAFNNVVEIFPEDKSVDYFTKFHYRTIAHEMVHTFQFPEYFSISSFANPYFQKYKSKKIYTTLSKYLYMDIPYSQLAYICMPKPKYYENYYEFEAEHFARRRYLER